MSRTSTALKRLGVPALAAVTVFAGVPAMLGTAQADHTGNATAVTITPDVETAAAGTCVPFTLTATGQDGSGTTVPAENTVIDVVISETPTATTTQDVDFCTTATGSTTPAAGSNATDSGPEGSSDRAEFTTGSDGTVVFGVVANEAGSVSIQAFLDYDNDNTRDAIEPQNFAALTVSDGGSEAVTTVDANPPTDTNVVGETHVITALLTNAANDSVAGVTPAAVIESTTATRTTQPSIGCTASNNEGVATCSYTSNEVGTDQIRVFVNKQAGNDASFEPEAGEPSDEVSKTWIAAQTGRNVDLTCAPRGTDTQNGVTDPNSPAGTNTAPTGDNTQTGETGAEDCVNQTTDPERIFTATVSPASGTDSTQGTLIRFTVTGGSGDETAAPIECTTGIADADGVSSCSTLITNPDPESGEVLTVTATIRGTSASDSGTLTFTNAPTDARNITLTPETASTAPGTVQALTATVTDSDGNPVAGVEVTFSESGAGAFRDGSSQVSRDTNAAGQVVVEVTSLSTETGEQTVTAQITEGGTQCGELANTGTDPRGGTLSPTNTATAGNCSDSSTVTFEEQAASPSPSPTEASPTASPTGSPAGPPDVPCTVPASITLDRDTIIATGSAQINVRATPNSILDVYAYSRPSTTFRVVRQMELGADGTASDRIVPPTNTRLYAQQRGCDASPSIVLNVRTSISMAVVRNGKQDYTFSGQAMPARPNGLIVSLYRVTNDGRQILTAQTRANANVGQPGFDSSRRAGSYTIRRVFTGTGRFGFVVRTGQDLQNAPGSSNVRSLLVF